MLGDSATSFVIDYHRLRGQVPRTILATGTHLLTSVQAAPDSFKCTGGHSGTESRTLAPTPL